MKEALLYQKLKNDTVRCQLCAHYCLIEPGHKGVCQVRENRSGTLYSLVYGRTISCQVDPIEKKPLNHFYPGSRSFSIATPGCNMHCEWCQNWEISQQPREQHFISGRELSPTEIVVAARQHDCLSIASTYTEPTIFFEYSFETAQLARKAGLANVYVSNGYMSVEMLELFHPWLDAANIDLKSFRDVTCRRTTGARLQPVLDSMKRIKDYGIWLEVTTLVVPGVNDDPAELKDMADFIVNELGPETPWHVSRFFPQYHMNNQSPTSAETLKLAWQLGRTAGLKYIYLGNMEARENTYCPACKAMLINRSRFSIDVNRIGPDSCCPDCGETIAGIGLWPGAVFNS